MSLVVGSVEFTTQDLASWIDRAPQADHQAAPAHIIAEFDVMAVEPDFDDHNDELGNDMAPTTVAQTTKPPRGHNGALTSTPNGLPAPTT